MFYVSVGEIDPGFVLKKYYLADASLLTKVFHDFFQIVQSEKEKEIILILNKTRLEN